MAASLTIILVGVPTSGHKFTFRTGNTFGFTPLDPATFSLADGETQVFTGVTEGDRAYFVKQTPDLNYKLEITSSNGSTEDVITIGSGEAVTLTFTNTFITPPVAGPSEWGLHRFSMRVRQEERS